ncbi:MAG: vWA domain-containing protein [Salibacteraceae bacterium]
MTQRILLFVSLLLLIGISNSTAQGTEKYTTRILFIYDASNSMNGSWNSGKKHHIASDLLAQTVDSLKGIDNLQVALRVYGHQKNYRMGQDCNDTKLEVPFGYNNHEKIKSKLKQITPMGTTPIAMTLEKSADDFTDCKTCRNIIILITDGVEECGGDPCTISMKLQRQGIVLKPFVIGIGIDLNFNKSFECLGTFYNVSNQSSFKNVLGIVISQALNETTAQINLVDAGKNPSETNTGVTLLDHNSGRELYNFVHTMNAYGNPDTLDLEPSYTYDLIAHTIPEVRKDSIVMIPGKHNILSVDAPQGYIELKSARFNSREEILSIVRKHGEMETINVQSLNKSDKYITGFYDIEVLTNPRLKITDVAVSQSHTTTVNIPTPGLLTITKGAKSIGGIYQKIDGKLKLVVRFNLNLTRESFYMLPGNYTILYRPGGAKSTMFTIEKEIKIEEGSSASINL